MAVAGSLAELQLRIYWHGMGGVGGWSKCKVRLVSGVAAGALCGLPDSLVEWQVVPAKAILGKITTWFLWSRGDR